MRRSHLLVARTRCWASVYRHNVLWIIMYPKWDLIGLYLYHCFLFSSLLVFTLLAVDRNRIPRKLLAFCFTIAILAPLLFPSLVLISAWPSGTSSTYTATQTLLHGVAGLIVGAIAGGFLSRLLTVDQNSINQRGAVIASMSLIGTMLGCQAALCMRSCLAFPERFSGMACSHKQLFRVDH